MTVTPSGVRYAWYGRVSTEDEQDPTLSFPRQLGNAARQVTDSGGRIVAHYYDIESGKRGYAARGSGGLDGFDIPIPRDGGLQDLLDHAKGRPAPFDRVIVESISRMSRNSSVAFRVEDELRQLGIRLCAADEPLEESFGTIVLRHVNIGIASGYHHELMVKSRQGYETAARQGWHNGGVALYGYRFVAHEHPNPHKAARGHTKRTLELDPVRAPVVRHIYDLYLAGGVGLTQIRDHLNVAPDRYPPPIPVDPARALGVWSRSSVWEVLRNPKYTGYQVWNRRARKSTGRMNPPETWIWSEEPSHPAIINRAEHDAAQRRAEDNNRTRKNTNTPAGSEERPEYLYRGILHCGICGLRMWGNRRGGRSCYYSCQPHKRRGTQIPADHPSHVYLNEKHLHTAVTGFLAEALFGPDRHTYWERCLTTAADDDTAAAPGRARIKELEDELADLERRLDRQVLNLEADDTTPALRRRITQRVAELEDAIADRQARFDDLAGHTPDAAPTIDDARPLLDQLPLIADQITDLPQTELRALLDALQMVIRYQPDQRAIDIEITLASQNGKTPAPRSAEVWSAPSGRFERPHTAPEADALSPELRGQTLRLLPSFSLVSGVTWLLSQ